MSSTTTSCRALPVAVLALGALLLAAGPLADGASAGGLPKQTRTFEYTGEWAYFNVPAGVTSIGLDLRGGRGGRGGYDLEEGGPPQPQGRITGSLPVAGTGSELVRIAVGANGGNGTVCMPGIGGAGGGNPVGFGGGKGGDAGLPYGCSGGGGGGGGASIVQVPNGFSDFVAARDAIVAGGGGGGYGAGANPAPTVFGWYEIVSGTWFQGYYAPTPLLSDAPRGAYDDRVSGDGYAPGIEGTAGQGWGNTLDPSGKDFKGPSWDGGGAGGGGGGIQGGQGGWVSDKHDVSAQPGKSGKNRAGDYRDLSAYLNSTYEDAPEGSVTITWNGPPAPTLGRTPAAVTTVPGVSIDLQGLDGATFTCKLDAGASTPCATPFNVSSLALGDHVLEVTQEVDGVSSEPTTVRWTIEPPFRAPTVTTTAPTLAKEPGTWRLGLGTTFTTGGDSRGAARLLTVQVSTARTRPSNSQPTPTAPTYANGVVSWAAEVRRASLAKPRWVRVGNRAGLWTRWVALPTR